MGLTDDYAGLVLDARSSFISQEQAQSVLDVFRLNVEHLSRSPGTAIERQVRVADKDLSDIWNWNSAVPSSVDKCVHELIFETVEKQPDAVAVSAWDGE